MSWSTISWNRSFFKLLKGYDLFKILNKVSSWIRPVARLVEIIWLHNTDNGFFRTENTSSSLASVFLAITIDSARSSGVVAIITPFDVFPIRCPDRPIRWTILVTSRGELYWMIKSVLPTSIPSSREDVHISVFNSLDLNWSSASILACLDKDPWWTPKGYPGVHIRNLEERISAPSRVFVKNSVETWSSIRALHRLRAAKDRGSRVNRADSTKSCSSTFGISTDRSICLIVSIETVLTGLKVFSLNKPPRYLATSSGAPTVADNPIRWKLWDFCFVNSSKRSNATANCAPRSSWASSCISSIITHLTLWICERRFFPTKRIWNVSGVVINISGGFLDCFARSLWVVSPCLTATEIFKDSPQEIVLFNISRFNARSGVI